MLLTGLEGQAVGLAALAVPGDADDAAGDLPAESVGHGHEAGVRAAVEQGHAEPLGTADSDVGADGAGLPQDGQGQGVGVDGRQAAALVDRGDRPGQVPDRSARGRVGQDGAQELLPGSRRAVLNGRWLGGQRSDPERLAAGQRHFDALGVQAAVQDDRAPGGPAGRPRHEQDRLGDRGGLVQQRGAGHRQAGQVADERLEEQLGLEPALADLRLVGRVGRGPGRVAQHVAGDDGGCEGGVVAAADHLGVRLVEGGHCPQGLNGLGLGQAAGGGGGLAAAGRGQGRQAGGDDGGGQILELVQAQGGQHGILAVARGADVAQDEGDVGNGVSSSHEDLRSEHEPAHILGDEPGPS